MMEMDAIRERLMRLIAGKKFAYWISDEAQIRIDDLNGAVGGGAAICLVKSVKKTGFTYATFTLDGARIVVDLDPTPDAVDPEET